MILLLDTAIVQNVVGVHILQKNLNLIMQIKIYHPNKMKEIQNKFENISINTAWDLYIEKDDFIQEVERIQELKFLRSFGE